MSRDYYNPYNRCGCCDSVLGANQPMYRGKVDDLCSACRHAVNKAVHYHDEDIEELDGMWKSPMGAVSWEHNGGVTPPCPGMDGY